LGNSIITFLTILWWEHTIMHVNTLSAAPEHTKQHTFYKLAISSLPFPTVAALALKKKKLNTRKT
jgi:hypothetical protein